MFELARRVHDILRLLGESPERSGLQDTPMRVAKSLQSLTQGYGADPRRLIESALFPEAHRGMVTVKEIEFYSLCEHHMLPFFGRAHVAYLPAGQIVGLSKIARLVEVFARRLQVQERMTTQICDVLTEVLRPRGVAVVVEARHLCMMMRGVQNQHATTLTTAVSGAFTESDVYSEFLRLLGR